MWPKSSIILLRFIRIKLKSFQWWLEQPSINTHISRVFIKDFHWNRIFREFNKISDCKLMWSSWVSLSIMLSMHRRVLGFIWKSFLIEFYTSNAIYCKLSLKILKTTNRSWFILVFLFSGIYSMIRLWTNFSIDAKLSKRFLPPFYDTKSIKIK